jgi:hypothetical protein
MPEIQEEAQVFDAPQLPLSKKIEDDPWLRDE